VLASPAPGHNIDSEVGRSVELIGQTLRDGRASCCGFRPGTPVVDLNTRTFYAVSKSRQKIGGLGFSMSTNLCAIPQEAKAQSERGAMLQRAAVNFGSPGWAVG